VKLVNLAVVGAGVGECSAAHFTRKYIPSVNVTIYDPRDRVGGRVLTCNAAGVNLELGAAFFNRFNRTRNRLVSTAAVVTFGKSGYCRCEANLSGVV
jgi:protoporphyrinogen oxidase